MFYIGRMLKPLIATKTGSWTKMQNLIQMEMWNMMKREHKVYNLESTQARPMNWLPYESFFSYYEFIMTLIMQTTPIESCNAWAEFKKRTISWTTKDRSKKDPRAYKMPQTD